MLATRKQGLPPIRPRNTTGGAPLSFAQQRLWFLQQIEPRNPFYNVAAAVTLRGHVRPNVLDEALHEIIRRHEILRTRFCQIDGEPVQMVNPPDAWRLENTDLTEQPDSQRETLAKEIAIAAADRPFDLTSDSLIRARLVRLEPDHHLLVLVLHHIICDGWSMNVIRRELTQLYAAFSAGQPSPLPDLELQYTDFAAWQRKWLPAQNALDDHLQYWISQLSNSPGAVQLPYDFSPTDQPDFGGATVPWQLSADLVRQLERFAAAKQGTLFMALLAAWKILLATYADQTDICVGAPVANRRSAQLEPLVGLFVNTLALRTDLSGDPTFRELFSRVRETCLQADAHQDLPLEKLVEELQPRRDLRQTPLFNTLFVMQDMPPSSVDSGDLRVTEIDFGLSPRTHFDVTLNVTIDSGRADLLLVYRTEMFQGQTVQRWLETYEILLAAVVSDPDRPLSELPLVNANDRQQLLDEWNPPTRDFPDNCIHELISKQAAQTPSAVAVEYAGQQVSYLELEQRANRLAQVLCARGTASGQTVGILLPRSPEIIVAMLAVLKAGASYVVYDPSNPARRVETMLRDAQVDLIITEAALAEKFVLEAGVSVLLDAEAPQTAAPPGIPTATCVLPHDLAYLIYTSGSSGVPKAVEVPHRGLVNHAVHLAKRMQVRPGVRQIQNLSLNFDASAEEIFPTLIGGGTIVMNPAPGDMTASQLLEFCRQNRVEILHVVAPMWHQLVEVLQQQGPELFAGLKTVVTGADSIRSAALAKWCRHLGTRLRMLFIYGVTEATIATTIYEVPPEFNERQRVPIGKPIANQRVYVLDCHLRPVPIGAAGELFIGGVGVARGYRQRPELTASRYLDDPFHDAPGSRMYRTGDRARWRSDGQLEFLGRIDDQVKVRGYRIEPGEIESVLAALETVSAVRVIAHEGPAGRRVVAYVVAAADQSPTSAELRSAVADRLPQHMVPAAVVLLDRLPVTPAGKVDDAALPVPEWGRPDAGRRLISPRNDIEALLASIWADLLRLEQVSVDANFFELGGDSILSLQVISRANAAGLQVTPKQLLQHQTIAALAAVVQPTTATNESAAVTGFSPLSPIQCQFFDTDLAQPNFFNQAVLLNANVPIAADVIQQGWTAVIEHHDVLCSLFAVEHGRWRQHFTAKPNEADRLQHIDLAAIRDGDLMTEIEKVSQRIQSGLDFTRGPIAAGAYLDLGDQRPARLLLAIHHLVVDAVSWRILIEDLESACRQIIDQSPVVLPPKTTSFKTWVQHLRDHARNPRLGEQAKYWLDMRDAQPLPVDARSVDNLVMDVDEVRTSLSPDDTLAFLTEAQRPYRTRVDEFLLAALAHAIFDWTGNRRVRIDCERHGRDDPFDGLDLSRTVGWFTTCVPVEIEVPAQEVPTHCLAGQGGTRDEHGQPGPAALLCAVKEQLRSVPRQGIVYGLARWLARDGALREEMAKLPPASISFNYLGRLDSSATDQGLLSLASEALGPPSHGENRRWHLLELVAYVHNEQLVLRLCYNRKWHNRATMVALLGGFTNQLGELIQHCLDPAVGQFTPSDFPLAEADQEDLAALSRFLSNDEADGER